MIINLREVFLGLFGCRGTQTFVVFHFPLLQVFSLCPLLKFVLSEKRFHFVALGGFEKRSHKFFEETIHSKERRPEVVDEID
jgi:hypothetical protein